MARARRYFIIIAASLLLPICVGCGKQPTASMAPRPTADGSAAAPKPAVTAAPTPSETPSPDMVFEDDGDIYFSNAFAATFSARTFPFDHTPTVLIYHTHTEEAFRSENETPAATLAPTNGAAASVRSTDSAQNVVRLGEKLRDALQQRGFTVQHDTTDHEPPSVSTAYERSRVTMEAYENIDLYIDLHRNAADMLRARNDVVLLDGRRTARMFFVVGTGLMQGDSSKELADWRDNYCLALSLTEQLRFIDARLAKDIRVKQRAYNQDKGLSLLVEIGHNANLLSDAENSIPYLADALAAVCTF